MALIHMDNFDAYGGNINYMADGVYAELGSGHVKLVSDPDPLATGRVILVDSDTAPEFAGVVMPVGRTTVGMGGRVWLAGIPPGTSQRPGMEMRDASNNPVLGLQFNPIGGIEICSRLRIGSIYASTSGPVVTSNAWYHVEWKAIFGVNTVTTEVRVEGVVVLTATFAVAGTFTVQRVGWGNYSTPFTAAIYYKDIILWDSSGSQNNNFMGSIVVASMIPNSDTAIGGWVPTPAGSNYDRINNMPPLDATEYISAAIPPNTASQYGLTDLGSTVTSVRAIRTMVRARKTDGGDGQLQVSLVSGASTGNGADRPITAAFTYWMDMFETDPNTSGAWTRVSANAAQLKLTRTV